MCNFSALCQYPNSAPYCLKHKKLLGIKDAAKVKKPIAKKSAKRIKEDKILADLTKAQKLIDKRCQMKVPNICTGWFEAFDHKQKTSPKNRLEKDNLIPSCNACNGWKESHPKEAEKLGLTISRFKK